MHEQKENAAMNLRRPLALLAHRMLLVFGLIALLALFGTQVFAARAESPSFVRIIHASPFVGAADVFLDGSKLLTSFLFGSVTDYAAVPAGPHKVQIALVGKGIAASAISETLSVSPGVAYTVAAIGTSATNLSLAVFVDNNIIAPHTAKVRVYHLAPNAGPVNVTTGGRTLWNGITYEEASGYVSIPAGSYTFDVNAPEANSTLPLATTLNANTVISVFAVGLVNGSPKIELVPQQVNGVPGLPQTGSDPNAPSPSSQPVLPWILGTLALMMLCASAVLFRLAYARR